MATQTLPDADRRRTIRVWDFPLRVFHWLLVATISLAFLSSEEGSPLSAWHIASGWLAFVLIAFRFIWGFIGGEHARWSNFLRPPGLIPHIRALARFHPDPTIGHNPLGAISVVLLLALSCGVIWTGVAINSSGETLHELLAWTLLGLIALHVAAVITLSVLTRENLAGAMITGSKPAVRHPGARNARRAPWFGYGLAALAISGAIRTTRAIDPFAFAPQRETYRAGWERP